MWSARRLGKLIGENAAAVNKKLADEGYLEGEPGAWGLTEKGRDHGEYRHESNGHGGSAERSWGYPLWGDSVAQDLTGKKFPGVNWYCDGCREALGNQTGFDDSCGIWTCTECSYDNDISENNIQ